MGKKEKYRGEVVCPVQLVPIGIKVSYPKGGSFNDIAEVKDNQLKYYEGDADEQKEIDGVYKEYCKLYSSRIDFWNFRASLVLERQDTFA